MAKRIITEKRAVRNILAVLDQATHEEYEAGRGWYRRARDEAKKLAVTHEIPLTAACHILAALSPNSRWERNVIDARNLCAGIDAGLTVDSISVSTYGANKRKAADIYLTAKARLPFEHILSGQKVTAFARNIEHPEDVSITVDVHAYSVAHGKRFTADTMPAILPRVYARLSDSYRAAGETVGLSGAEVQAITWTVWKRIHKI